MTDLRSLSNDWPAISRWLDEGLALEPDQRSAWLAALAEPDSVKQKLRDLLLAGAGVETDDFLGTLPKLSLGPAATSPREDAATAGAVIGPYRLIRELGVGGMGLVWLAERVDGGLKRPVALKLPHLNWSRGLAERMSRERDILASLDHPNIARLYDAGLDEHGRPYLALEYVEGEAIDAYCERRSMSVADRLRLVLQVARAVAHAHARLVVHRDLKPANILVTEQGEVRLLDFGVAKLMEGTLTQDTQLTQQGGHAMTPGYASPEQIRGEPLGTASDVYSLGVVTYRLLAGVSPYTLKRQSAAALEDAIASIDPPLASVACADKAVAKELKGDIDAVLNKALKKNPAERYASVDALIADIENHLGNRPVQAQPDRLGYRTAKFLRRHRWPVAFGTAAALALMVSVSVALWQAQSASKQRDRALALLSRNEAITEFLELFVTEAAEADRPMKLGEMLGRSETMVDKQFKGEPETRAVVLAMLGMHHRTLGEANQAEALVARAIESASTSNDVSLKARLTCAYASVLEQLGRVDEARRNLLATASRNDIDAETVGTCFAYLAYLAQNVNDGAGAVDYARRALARLDTSQRASPGTRAALTGSLAYGLHLMGRNDEASREFAASLRMFEALGREANVVAISVRNNWGLVSLGSGDVKTGLKLYDDILALLARNGGSEPPPYVLGNRARALESSGRYSEASSAYELALAAAKRAGNPGSQAFALLGMSSVARDSGDLKSAQSYLRQVEQLGVSGRPQGGPAALAEHIVRGRIALSNGDLPLARNEFTLALSKRQPNGATVSALAGRAEVALREGQPALASADAQEALRFAQSLQGGTPYSARTGLVWLIEAEIRAQQGAASAAQEAYANAATHLTHTVDAAHPALQRAQAMAAGAAPVSSR
jgi:eukaryotic-like serine/threonine-protein kinase